MSAALRGEVRHHPSGMAQAALDCAARGWHVHPCRADNKRPMTAHGLHDATTDAGQITAWWTRWPNAMVGVRTGPESGLWALDLDVEAERDGRRWLDDMQRVEEALPDTIASCTPRGGLHFPFRWTEGVINSADKIAPGVDVRGSGGYVIVPPSTRSDGAVYTWHQPPGLHELAEAPPWLLAMVRRPASPILAAPAHTTALGASYAEVALDRECADLARTGRGGRNHALNVAAFNLGQLVGAGGLDPARVRVRLLDAATANGLLTEDGVRTVEATIESGLRGGEAKPREPSSRATDFEREYQGGKDRVPAVVSPPRARIEATPFAWIDPKTIPMREWLYGQHYIRRYVSVTVSPGGVGKSSLALAEALAMTSGRPLLGVEPVGQFNVWYWNGEDPEDETQRRVMATALHYGLERDDVEGRLFANSGRSTEIVIAEQTAKGVTVAVPVVDDLTRTIRENGIDLVIIDPFVSSHRVTENDNMAIDRVAKTWAKIADETNCAVELVHHSRKTNGAEVTVEDGRGAVALLNAGRSGRILNVMGQDEAERAGVERRRLHFRVDNGKANLAPPPEGTSWFKLASVDLGNGPLDSAGDSIGVVTTWKWPDPMDDVSVSDLRAAQKAVGNGRWRENVQAKDWVGIAVATALGKDLSDPAQKAKLKAMLKVWIANGMFVVVTGKDEKGNDRPYVEVGKWAND